MNRFLIRHEAKEGNVPAPVISQYREIFRQQRLHLTVGGYRNKQASVLQRRHEFFDLSAGWDEHDEHLSRFVELGLGVKTALRSKLYGFGKNIGVTGLSDKAEQRFYYDSEPTIHSLFRDMDWEQAAKAYDDLKKELSDLARKIFDNLTESYRNDPKNIKFLAISRRSLEKALKELA